MGKHGGAGQAAGNVGKHGAAGQAAGNSVI